MVSDFCEGRYSSKWLEKKDFDNIFALEGEEYEELRKTIYKLTDNLTYNEKEYQICLDNDNN